MTVPFAAPDFTWTAGTPGSLLFLGAAGAVAQNNAALFWDTTAAALGVGGPSSAAYRVAVKTLAGGSGMSITGFNTASFSGIDFYDPTPTFQAAFGYGNSAVAIPHVQGKGFWYSGGPDFVYANGTANMFSFGMTAGSTSLELANGSGAGVGDASTAKLRYNSGTGHLEVSLNGAAYVQVVTL